MAIAKANLKRYGIAGGTFVCIIATGYFMQAGSNAPKPQASGVAMASVAPGVQGVSTPVAISDVALTSAANEPPMQQAGTDDGTLQLEEPKGPDAAAALPQLTPPAPEPTEEAVIRPEPAAPMADPMAAPATEPQQEEIAAASEPAAAENFEPKREKAVTGTCEITMSGMEIAGALVKLDLDAPCLANERVTLHHAGMMFTETTDAAGKLEVVAPALTKDAEFIASFANGEGSVARVDITSLDLFDRAVVQSDEQSSVGLHALEYGADYEDRGHISAENPGEIADAALGKGGFILTLGNPALDNAKVAQVYTFPASMATETGEVALSVEIEVTNANCGLDLEAQALETRRGGPVTAHSLDLTMPDCDAVGDYLVLKNLVDDLKVAATN